MTDSSDAPHDMNAATDETTPASPTDTLSVLVRKVALSSLILIGVVATAMMALAWTIDHFHDIRGLVRDIYFMVSWGNYFWGALAATVLCLSLMFGSIFIYEEVDEANQSAVAPFAIAGFVLTMVATLAMSLTYDAIMEKTIYESVAFAPTFLTAILSLTVFSHWIISFSPMRMT
jgi:hypothetical protein